MSSQSNTEANRVFLTQQVCLALLVGAFLTLGCPPSLPSLHPYHDQRQNRRCCASSDGRPACTCSAAGHSSCSATACASRSEHCLPRSWPSSHKCITKSPLRASAVRLLDELVCLW